MSSWILACSTLEFEGPYITAAHFDHQMFRNKYMKEMEAFGPPSMAGTNASQRRIDMAPGSNGQTGSLFQPLLQSSIESLRSADFNDGLDGSSRSRFNSSKSSLQGSVKAPQGSSSRSGSPRSNSNESARIVRETAMSALRIYTNGQSAAHIEKHSPAVKRALSAQRQGRDELHHEIGLLKSQLSGVLDQVQGEMQHLKLAMDYTQRTSEMAHMVSAAALSSPGRDNNGPSSPSQEELMSLRSQLSFISDKIVKMEDSIRQAPSLESTLRQLEMRFSGAQSAPWSADRPMSALEPSPNNGVPMSMQYQQFQMQMQQQQLQLQLQQQQIQEQLMQIQRQQSMSQTAPKSSTPVSSTAVLVEREQPLSASASASTSRRTILNPKAGAVLMQVPDAERKRAAAAESAVPVTGSEESDAIKESQTMQKKADVVKPLKEGAVEMSSTSTGDTSASQSKARARSRLEEELMNAPEAPVGAIPSSLQKKKSKRRKPLNEQQAARIIQRFFMRVTFNVKRAKHAEFGSAAWVREAVVNYSISTTNNPHLIAEALVTCVETSNADLAVKVLSRIMALYRDASPGALMDAIPLENISRAETSLDSRKVLSKSTEDTVLVQRERTRL